MLQLVTYFAGYLATGVATLPQPAISVGTTWTSIVLGMISRVSPGLASWSMMPTIVNLVLGWVILGLALLGLWAFLGKFLMALAVVGVVVLLFLLLFGLRLPVTIALPTNSTSAGIFEVFLS
jgi:hypothetical protein